jgi:hypothetical protein
MLYLVLSREAFKLPSSYVHQTNVDEFLSLLTHLMPMYFW